MNTTIDESIGTLQFASDAQSIAESAESNSDTSTVAAAINLAALTGQTSCIVERDLHPETIQSLINHGYTLETIGRPANSTIPLAINWSKFVTKTIACDYSSVAQNSPIYNSATLESVMWVELPAVAKNFSDITTIEQANIWLKIPIALLDITEGVKVYQAHFTHNSVADTLTLYFGYTIQDDEPATPYVYLQ